MAIGPRPPDVLVAIDNDVLNDWRFENAITLEFIAEYIRVVKVPPAIPSQTIFEVMHGFEKSLLKSPEEGERTKQDREKIQRLIDSCEVLPFDQDAAKIAAYIWPRLTKSQRNQLWRDLFIASTALAHDYGVATRNKEDYELIKKHTPPDFPSLRIEIWKG